MTNTQSDMAGASSSNNFNQIISLLPPQPQIRLSALVAFLTLLLPGCGPLRYDCPIEMQYLPGRQLSNTKHKDYTTSRCQQIRPTPTAELLIVGTGFTWECDLSTPNQMGEDEARRQFLLQGMRGGSYFADNFCVCAKLNGIGKDYANASMRHFSVQFDSGAPVAMKLFFQNPYIKHEQWCGEGGCSEKWLSVGNVYCAEQPKHWTDVGRIDIYESASKSQYQWIVGPNK